ncbi:MAG: hypothetical protein FJ138_17695, partial [Deltaproteobacteria bacterium]|nr:hypothetical protein [Deltaproteobacteria bacterium]
MPLSPARRAAARLLCAPLPLLAACGAPAPAAPDQEALSAPRTERVVSTRARPAQGCSPSKVGFPPPPPPPPPAPAEPPALAPPPPAEALAL